jgi:hypothetical protein
MSLGRIRNGTRSADILEPIDMQTTRPQSSLVPLFAACLGAFASFAAAQDLPAERPTVEQVVSQVKQY